MKKRQNLIWGILFSVVCISFVGYIFMKVSNKDTNPPTITFDQPQLVVDIHSDKKELLNGVKAFDKEDGDVSASVLVEEITTMVEPGVCIATYSAFDKSNQVGKAQRQITYTNYDSPKFRITSPLVVSSAKVSDILEHVTATDCMEGDITNRVKLVELESVAFSSFKNCELQVSNHLGDSTTLPIVIEIKDPVKTTNEPLRLNLFDYVVYTKVNQPLEYPSYIASVSNLNRNYAFDNPMDKETIEQLNINQDQVLSVDQVEIQDNVDYEKPGNYTVEYQYTDDEGRTAMTTLHVVVRA